MNIKPITDEAIDTVIDELLVGQDFSSPVAERAARMMLTRKIRTTVNEARVMLHVKNYIRSELKGEYASGEEVDLAVDKLIDQALQAKSLAFDEDSIFHLSKISETLEKKDI